MTILEASVASLGRFFFLTEGFQVWGGRRKMFIKSGGDHSDQIIIATAHEFWGPQMVVNRKGNP